MTFLHALAPAIRGTAALVLLGAGVLTILPPLLTDHGHAALARGGDGGGGGGGGAAGNGGSQGGGAASAGAPGNSAGAPGQGGAAPGNSANAPGQASVGRGDAPGRSASAPGQAQGGAAAAAAENRGAANDRGALSSALGGLNAANAAARARENASPNSRVGRLSNYEAAMVEAFSMPPGIARDQAIARARAQELEAAANRPVTSAVVQRVDALLGLPATDPTLGVGR